MKAAFGSVLFFAGIFCVPNDAGTYSTVPSTINDANSGETRGPIQDPCLGSLNDGPFPRREVNLVASFIDLPKPRLAARRIHDVRRGGVLERTRDHERTLGEVQVHVHFLVRVDAAVNEDGAG